MRANHTIHYSLVSHWHDIGHTLFVVYCTTMGYSLRVTLSYNLSGIKISLISLSNDILVLFSSFDNMSKLCASPLLSFNNRILQLFISRVD